MSMRRLWFLVVLAWGIITFTSLVLVLVFYAALS